MCWANADVAAIAQEEKQPLTSAPERGEQPEHEETDTFLALIDKHATEEAFNLPKQWDCLVDPVQDEEIDILRPSVMLPIRSRSPARPRSKRSNLSNRA